MARRVGILGLGKIGRAVASCLGPDGFELAAVRRPSTMDFERLLDTPATLARWSEVVVSCLATPDAMHEAFLGSNGLVAGAHAGLIVVEMGTFPARLKRELAEALAGQGAAMLDCPISGTPPVVARREGMLFVSGDEGIARACADLFESVSPKHRYVGEFGAGMTTKLVTNLLVILNTFSLAEAFVLGTRAGLDPQLMIETIGPSFAGSRVFDFRAPMMAERRFLPAPGPARIVWKDLQYIREEVECLGLAAPLLHTALEWYARMIEDGRGEEECAGIFETLGAASRSAEPG